MKTKNKMLALVEIAILLCSVFLVALPVIAAAASEVYEPGPLDVFGNANEDDAIDMRDTTYIKLVIFGKKPETNLADANYDGKVSMLDVGQTKLIILGREKKLTFIDIFGEVVTVNKPINRLVGLRMYGTVGTRILGARDKIVAIGWSDARALSKLFPVLSKLPYVGGWWAPCDYEAVLSLKPDAVQTGLELRDWAGAKGLERKREYEEKLPGIPLISLNMGNMDKFLKGLRTLGYILDREDEAKEFEDWFEGQVNTIRTRTERLPEDKKPLVYYYRPGKPYQSVGKGYSSYEAIALAGGRNIVDELGLSELYPDLFELDAEAVIEQNPEFIIIQGQHWNIPGSYESDDPSGYMEVRQELLDRPVLANVDAVKNGRVYVVDYNILCDNYCYVVASSYLAKLFYHDLFEDIDPQAIHQEYVDRFCHIDFDVREHGVFVYPPPEEWKPWRS